MSLWRGVDPLKARINWRSFVAMLDRGLSLPRDAISVICEFWLRVDEYDQHTNLL